MPSTPERKLLISFLSLNPIGTITKLIICQKSASPILSAQRIYSMHHLEVAKIQEILLEVSWITSPRKSRSLISTVDLIDIFSLSFPEKSSALANDTR
ncbi:MAG: hypothetical protein U0Z26_02325 [Anaerolineales bacterium]